jgi:hypothetical protein
MLIYTAIFNHYDALVNPPDDNNDYICFTDNPKNVPENWETRKIAFDELSPKLASGKVKTLPHKYFSEFEYSIWIDGNIVIKKDPSDIIDEYLQDTNIAVKRNPFRDCVYKEAKHNVKRGLTDRKSTQQKMEKYRCNGFPENFGLSETRILIRKHNSEDVISAMETWWEEYKEGPKRDQLSFEYAAWVTDLEYSFLPSKIDVDSDYFQRYPHKYDTLRKQSYEYHLQNRWHPSSLQQYVVSHSYMYFYLSIHNLLQVPVLLRKEGLRALAEKFKNHYL